MQKTPFIPPKLPLKVDYNALIPNITSAHRAIASLNTLLNQLPNPELLGRTMQTKEAVLSSQIEGTQATMNEVFEYEALRRIQNTEKEKDIGEILNYRNALDLGVKRLDKNPLSENLIKDLHLTLLKSGRGSTKDPGNFRKIQVFIGKHNATIENASFIPPSANQIVPLFRNLEEYLNSKEEKDELVQIALAHYQFEAIHPFLDGNGRVGRLLISLFLYDRNLLSHPFLYLSEYFEAHRKEYYALLKGVSEDGDLENWIKFFLDALKVQSEKAEYSGKKILNLYQQYKEEKIVHLNSIYAINLLDSIFAYPVFTTSSKGPIRANSKIKNTQTFFNLVAKFVKAGIVRDLTPHKKRDKIYIFDQLLKILSS